MAQIIPLTRSGVVGHYAGHFEALGAPVERLLRQAGIPKQLLNIPDAVIPLHSAYRFDPVRRQTLWDQLTFFLRDTFLPVASPV